VVPKGHKGVKEAERRAALVEDVENLLGAGESVEQVCIKLGRSATALQRMLYREGRRKLARPFGVVVKLERKLAGGINRRQGAHPEGLDDL
jgi:hypothetical protein